MGKVIKQECRATISLNDRMKAISESSFFLGLVIGALIGVIGNVVVEYLFSIDKYGWGPAIVSVILFFGLIAFLIREGIQKRKIY